MPELRAPVALEAALRHDTIRRGIEVDGRVSIADLKDRLSRRPRQDRRRRLGLCGRHFVCGSPHHRHRRRPLGARQPEIRSTQRRDRRPECRLMQAYIPISLADHETFVVAGRRPVSQSIRNVRNRLEMFAID